MMLREINLNLSRNYVDNAQWDQWAMVREIYANASDMDPMWEVEWSADTHILRVSNKGWMSIDALGLGNSAKADKNNAIGQFGEGLKIGALVGARLGNPIAIRTGNYLMTFHFRKPYELESRANHPGFDDERWQRFIDQEYLFAIVQMDMPFVDKTIVMISNWLTPQLYADRFIGGGLDGGVKILFGHEPSGDLITEGGRLYNKGVYIMDLHDFHFGYNLNKITMNRDRTVANSYEINSHMRKLWSQCDDPRLWVEFFRAVENGKAEKRLSFQWNFGDEKDRTFAAVKEGWKLRYKDRPAALHTDVDTRFEAIAFSSQRDRPVMLEEATYGLVKDAGIQTFEQIMQDEWEQMSTRKKNALLELEDVDKKILSSLRSFAKQFWVLEKRNDKVAVEYTISDKSDYIVQNDDGNNWCDEYTIRLPKKAGLEKKDYLAMLLLQLAKIKYGSYTDAEQIADIAAELMV